MILFGIPALAVAIKSSAGFKATFFGKPETDTMKKFKSLKGAIDDHQIPGNNMG
ncbi:MAG: hypothetical protein Q8R79_03020 [Legionellaceae bacterium]|nr:hypothetical protein [Legionellaceae bacterium]